MVETFQNSFRFMAYRLVTANAKFDDMPNAMDVIAIPQRDMLSTGSRP